MIHLGLGALGGLPHEERLPVVAALVEALVACNRAYLSRNPNTIPLYFSDVRYEEAPEEWWDIVEVMSHRRGDCKSLAAWRLAELRERGEEARVRVVLREEAAGRGMPSRVVVHVEILRADGDVEDPSRRLAPGLGLRVI